MHFRGIIPGSVFPVRNRNINVNNKNRKFRIGTPGDKVFQIVGIKNTKYNTLPTITVI